MPKDHDIGEIIYNPTAPTETILKTTSFGVEIVYSNDGYVFIRNQVGVVNVMYTIQHGNTVEKPLIPYHSSVPVELGSGVPLFLTNTGLWDDKYTPKAVNDKIILSDLTIYDQLSGTMFRCDMNNQVVKEDTNMILASTFEVRL